MMIRAAFSITVAAVLTFSGVNRSSAAPLDLSGFGVVESVTDSVVESGGAITFSENFTDLALYYYNDSFLVDLLATTLSFEYNLTLGSDDVGDYLEFNVNHGRILLVDTPVPGHFEFDLTGFQGQTISIDWSLIWDGDGAAGTTARVHHIDIATEEQTAPVPEPATLLLFGTGLAGLAAGRRIKNYLQKT